VLDPDDAPARLVRHGLEAFLSVVDQYPTAFSMLLQPGSTSQRVLEDSKKIADVLAALIAGQLRTLGVDAEGAEPWGHALNGAVAGATHWWLEHRTISKEALIGHLSTVILGSLERIAREAGVVIDLELPIKSQTIRMAP
jgi:hypothetical protein